MKNNGLKSILAIVLGLIAGALLMAAMGHNPAEGYKYLAQGGLKSVERIANTFATATPLILTGLSLAFAFKTGLFNMYKLAKTYIITFNNTFGINWWSIMCRISWIFKG